jgi:GNAT superfamily N-acetyltransferase
MASQSLDGALEDAAFEALARAHRLCLPDTASSRAGLAVLHGLYTALARDAASHVIWHPAADPRHHGAFAAGTVRYRETEAHTRRSLPKASLARLALRVASMPGHVLARRRWESAIPHEGIGYVLTLGAASALIPAAQTLRGSAVLEELEAWFLAQGCTASWVDTELSNRRAHAFYLRRGYLEVARDFGQVLLHKPLGTANSAPSP